jgi:DNA-binding IscR family transcriptional regulator
MIDPRARTAIIAVVEIARRQWEPNVDGEVERDGKFVKGADLSLEITGMPSALESMLARLAEAGVLESARGHHGGYRLAKGPVYINLGMIMRAACSPAEPRPAVGASSTSAIIVDAVLSRAALAEDLVIRRVSVAALLKARSTAKGIDELLDATGAPD